MNKSGDAALNAVCPYFTMFPLAFPHTILKRYALSNQTVCDPFCGRGTTVLAARMLDLKAIGIDSNPLAAALTDAKLVHTTPQAIVEAMRSVLEDVPIAPSRRILGFGVSPRSVEHPVSVAPGAHGELCDSGAESSPGNHSGCSARPENETVFTVVVLLKSVSSDVRAKT
jgi:DNA methylase